MPASRRHGKTNIPLSGESPFRQTGKHAGLNPS